MATGRIIQLMANMGDTYVAGGVRYALLNGQELDRGVFVNLSSLWPAGVYGGGTVSDPIHLPDTDQLYLRGANLGSNNDPDGGLRTALSGVGPTGNNVGSFQLNGLGAHVHASGTQFTQTINTLNGGGGENGNRNFSNIARDPISITIGTDPQIPSRPVFLQPSGVGTKDFDLDATRVYLYIEN